MSRMNTFLVPLAIAYAAALAGGCDDFDPPHPPSGRPGDGSAPPTLADAGWSEPSSSAIDAGSTDPGAPDSGAPAPAGPDMPAAPRNPLEFARAGHRHVFVPNPRDHTVVIVEPSSLQVRHARCEIEPLLVAASTHAELAIALDPAADRACVLRVADDRVDVSQVSVAPGANAVAFSPDGGFAVVYHDARLDPADRRSHTQDVSVIELSVEPRAANALVGLAPRDVIFAGDGLALVTTAAGVSTLELSAATQAPLRAAPRAFAPELRGLAHEVRIDTGMDGARALAFEPRGDRLHVLDLASDAPARSIDLAAWGADPDASDAGPIERLAIADVQLERGGHNAWVALSREQTLLRVGLDGSNAIERIALPGQPSERISLIGGEPQALFVRAEAGSDGRGQLLLLGSRRKALPVLLPAAGDTLAAVDGGEALLVLQRTAENGFTGFSVVGTRDGAVALERTDASPSAVEISSELGLAAVTVPRSNTAAAQLHLVDLAGLGTRALSLESEPVALGICAGAGRVFVQQEHPDGRLVIVDPNEGSARTLSGLLIASRVRE